MIEQVKSVLARQFDAALCMINNCLVKCPTEHWDGKVAKYPFWQVAYHTLCFVDLYLTTSKDAFAFRSVHPQGWKEFDDEHPSRRFSREEIAGYLVICRQKAAAAIAGETEQSLAGPSGFDWLRFSRLELHIYNIRHIQHHAGQLGAYLRRIEPTIDPHWVGSGWR
jgi:hypothetical protein